MDEPTSGLDPGLDKSRDGSDERHGQGGRTVIIVTHSVAQPAACATLASHGPGGRVDFYGPAWPGPQLLREKTGLGEVFSRTSTPSRPATWGRGLQAVDVTTPRRSGRCWPEGLPEGAARVPGPHAPSPRGAIEAGIHPVPAYLESSPQTAATWRCWGSLTIVTACCCGRGPVPGRRGGAWPGKPGTNGEADPCLLVLISGAFIIGAANAVRELVKGRSIYARERAAGLLRTPIVFARYRAGESSAGFQACSWWGRAWPDGQMPANWLP